ncbi:MAG: hypothetical protein HY304_07045 [candidate division Zixibacteria bacterium]|nr:hypothetical protein [candidate division Zixibacteria bacterium]
MVTLSIHRSRPHLLVALAVGVLLMMVGCAKERPVGPRTNPNHVAGANCGATGCHSAEHQNWALSLHAAEPAEVLLNSDHNTEEQLIDECLQCHTPFQAADYHVGDFVQPLDQTGPWHLVDSNTAKWQAIKCEVCHDPTSTISKKLAFYDFAAEAYVSVASTTELCEKCHQAGTDDSRDLAGSVHEGIQCSACHLKPGSQMNIDPHESCGRCHPGVNPGHPDVTTLNTTYRSADSPNNIHFVQCATCHPTGVALHGG